MPNVLARSARLSLDGRGADLVRDAVAARDVDRVAGGESEVPIVTRRRELVQHVTSGTAFDGRAIGVRRVPPAPSVGVTGVDLDVRHPGFDGEPGPFLRVEPFERE